MKNCKQCNKEFVITKKEKIFCSLICRKKYLKKCKIWRNTHRELRKETAREYYKNSEKRREYQKEYDKKRVKDGYFKKYSAEHKKEKRDWQRNSRKDINKRLKYNLRKRIWDALKGYNKSNSTVRLIGCSIEDLKIHLEKQFTSGMTWQNYGKWHVDHIKGCKEFDLSKKSEQLKCFNYKNLQPLWAVDNLTKHCYAK